MSICEKCDPAGHIGGEEILFLQETRKKLVSAAAQYTKNINAMLNNEMPMNKHIVALLQECLNGISAIDNLLIVLGSLGA